MRTKLLIAGVCSILAGIGTAQADGDAAAGEAKAAMCGGCHGADGKGVEPNPPLTGLEPAYFVEQLQAYKSGARPHDMMKSMVSALSDEDMADLAAYYATLQ